MRVLRPEVRLLKPEMRSEVSHQLIMFVVLVVVEAGHVVVVHVVPVGKLYSPIGLWHDLNTFNGENKLLYLLGSCPRGHGVMDRASKSASLLVLRVSTRSPRIGEKAAYKTCEVTCLTAWRTSFYWFAHFPSQFSPDEAKYYGTNGLHLKPTDRFVELLL